MLGKKIKKTDLMPFMSVAGDETDSRTSILTKAGITCVPVLKGTADYDAFVNIWVDHVRGLMGHF